MSQIKISKISHFSLGLLLVLCWLALGMVSQMGCSHAVEEIQPPADTTADGTVAKTESGSLLPAASTENDWPWWRGTNRDNHALGPMPPTSWSETENVLWKSPVPGRGHASPIVWGDKVFVATAEEDKESQSLLCYDRATGEQKWNTELHQGGWPRVHAKNSHASPTPACDGERVFAVFTHDDAIWVSAVDLEGKLVWQTEAGPFEATHGYGSSPVIYQDFLIVMSDNSNGGFVAALNRKSGEIIWRIRRARDDSYASPVIAHVAGKDQLLISGQSLVVSYNPLTGEEYWQCRGPARTTANTMAFKGDVVYASGGYPEKSVMAIRADGSGDVSGTHILWEDSFKLYVPSPLVVEDRLLAMGDGGVAQCYSLKDGKVLWKERLGGGFSASPVLVGDVVYSPDERGKLHVFRATEKKLEKIASNQLRGGMATPVILEGQIFLRTESHLYCIGNTSAETETDTEEAEPMN